MKTRTLKFVSVFMYLLIILSFFTISSNAQLEELIKYNNYIERYSDGDFNGDTLSLEGGDFTSGELVEKHNNFEGKSNVVKTGDKGFASYDFHIEKAGLYAVGLEYLPLEGNGNVIRRVIYIDGKSPINSFVATEFNRIYKDDGDIIHDMKGNDIRPSTLEVTRWTSTFVKDKSGYFGDRVYIYLKSGQHEIKIESIQEPMAISKLWLESKKNEVNTHEKAIEKAKNAGAKSVSNVLDEGILTIQAESTLNKSDPSLYPINDISSHNTQPYSYNEQKLNTIGGNKWNSVGQWMSWEVDVPESGFYNIGFRFKQDFGKQSIRKLTIDGELPYIEAEEISFKFGDRWQKMLAGNDNGAYLFYLEKGKREIALEVSLGLDTNSMVLAEQVLRDLNAANWQLMTVLGSSPDTNRDYQIEKNLPEVIEIFRESAELLEQIGKQWEREAQGRDSNTAEILQLAAQLKDMGEKPRKIPNKFLYFRDLLTSYSNLVITVRQQPLLLDYLFLYEPQQQKPKEKSNVLLTIKYGILRFINSFFSDYSMVGTQSDANTTTTITAWLGNSMIGGRDQAQSLNQLIQQKFTPKTNVAVKVQLVPAGTVMTASLAGKGPDISLFAGASDAVNYAVRDAAEELSKYEGFDGVVGDFHPETLVPYTFKNGVYALPETMQFMMMFYRKDILQKLGIDYKSINTWQDVLNMLPIIQASNMNLGIPAMLSANVSVASNSYFMFLYQREGTIYKNNGNESALSEKVALDSFNDYMKFYTSYGLPFIYSFETRFRTGEIPIGIADYTTYNLLQISAPEIKELWEMAPIPGTADESGNDVINRTSPVSGTSAIMMKSAENKQACWGFLKWWVSEQTQYDFGMDVESVLGVGSRYNTANLKALSRLPWSTHEKTALLKQMESLKGIPEIPGGYITTRSIDFAVKSVYNSDDDARKKLLSYVNAIDAELEAKRREFILE